MANKKKRKKRKSPIHIWRRVTQFFFLFALNPNILSSTFFVHRGICFPAMNCWACPAAAYGCPIGAIGHLVAWGIIPFLALGVMLILGAVAGRIVCGWVCPFGLIQDLMNKIPSPKIGLPKSLSYGKYVFLIVTVFYIPIAYGVKDPIDLKAPVTKVAAAGETGGATDPGGDLDDFGDFGLEEDPLSGSEDTGSPDLFGGGDDLLEVAAGEKEFAEPEAEAAVVPRDLFFCNICPCGALEAAIPVRIIGIPGEVELEGSSETDWVGFLFLSPRMWILWVFLILFILSRRPFCRVMCPIGATFALLNRFSFFRIKVEKEKCKDCNLCAKTCPVGKKVCDSPNAEDCVRCYECVDSCRFGATKPALISPQSRTSTYWD